MKFITVQIEFRDFAKKLIKKYFSAFSFLFLLKRHKRKIFTLSLISLITAALSTIAPLISKNLIDNFYLSKSWRVFYWAALANLLIIVSGLILGIVSSFFSTYLKEKFYFDLSIDMQKKISKVNYNLFQNRNTGEHIFRHTSDIDSIVTIIAEIFPSTVLIIFQIVFFFIIAFKLTPQLTIIYMAVIPLLIIVIILKNKKLRPLQVEMREFSSDINDFHSQFHQGILTTKIFAREKFEEIRLLKAVKYKFKQTFKLWRADTIYSSLTIVIGSTWNMIMLFYGWSLVINGDLTLGSLIAMQMYFNKLITPFQTGADLFGRLIRSSVAAERLQETLNAEEEFNIKDYSTKLDFTKGIKLTNVSFSYSQDTPVLTNINMKIEPSLVVGITGPSGAGKTTIINIIAKLYDIKEGEISIDGKNINSLNCNLLRSNIGIVSQEPFLFSGTIKENILYGNLEASMEDIIRASKAANIDQFIFELKDGFDTILGKNGILVSTGQKKRLGLARALVKNAPILILDEFTASLDEVSEKNILNNIRELYPSKSIIIISHKVSNLLDCNVVFVINNGTVAEYGEPKKLIENEGLFRKLYQLQYKFFSLHMENEYDTIEKIKY